MEKILSDIVDFKTKSKQIAIDSKTPITASSIDNELWIKLLDNIIETFSKQRSNSSIPFFQQSPSHVLIALITLKYYLQQKPLYKTALIELIINSHLHHKSPLSENKYIDDSIGKGYLLISSSPIDKRKKVLVPSKKMILELKEWLLKITII